MLPKVVAAAVVPLLLALIALVALVVKEGTALSLQFPAHLLLTQAVGVVVDKTLKELAEPEGEEMLQPVMPLLTLAAVVVVHIPLQQAVTAVQAS